MYNYKYIWDTDTQFGAVCFKVKKKFIYVAFEGTDNLLSGWKEDFQMAYEFPVPSQKLAVKYLNENIKNTVKAIGTVYGETWYMVKVNYPLNYEKKTKTGKSKRVVTINFFNNEIQLLNFNKYENYRLYLFK